MDEKVLGGLEVETRLMMGMEHLFLLFTQKRLILAHLAKVGRDSMALSGLLGGLARGIGKGAKKSSLLEKLAGLSPDSIVAMDKDNFAVDYGRVVSLAVEPGDYARAEMILVTTDMKVEMSASLVAIRGLRETIESQLGAKVSFSL